jgi:hypothetical protein
MEMQMNTNATITADLHLMCSGSSLGNLWTAGGTKMYSEATKHDDVVRQ